MRHVAAVVVMMVSMMSCRSSPTGGNSSELRVGLSLEYASCKEVWLKIWFNDTAGGEYAVNRDGNMVLTGHFNGRDTVVIDTTAVAGRTYSYICWKMVNGVPEEGSSSLVVRTMDTTSHNFTWETFRFGGEAGSCILRDVAIINDTDIWAVGGIYLKDSTTGKPDPQPYNLAVWDGKSWRLKRIEFLTFCEQPYTSSYEAQSIAAFSAQDIWITSGSQIARWDGTSQTYPACIPVFVNKMWGTSDRNLYAVGYNGLIANYDGGTWHKIESGTTTDIDDIWGVANPDGTVRVLCTVTSRYHLGDYKILSIGNRGMAKDTLDSNLNSRVYGVWFDSSPYTFVCGDGVNMIYNGEWHEANLPRFFTTRVRGNGINDVIVVGCCGMVAHWNGVSWYTYPTMPGNYEGLAVKGNLVVAVGWVGGSATVLMGRRID